MQTETTRDDQLARKLELMLGSGTDWMALYRDFAVDHRIADTMQVYEDHNINLFVKQTREARK